MVYRLHEGDIPGDLSLGQVIAVDTETMGLSTSRDRLCLVQLSDGNGQAHLVRFPAGGGYEAPNLKALLADPGRLKLFHFARFDLAAIKAYLGIDAAPVYCTKIASRLVRTYTDRHGLKELCRELLGVDVSKQEQSSDWGSADLSDSQLRYAAADVLYLHRLRERLDIMLAREGRADLAQRCFEFLPTRAALDLSGWAETDIFAHS
ncbi:ribonuclease D [Arboricoccus pini]|uniref:Ribonuclease D n=1 Tax=Arboricoccus pini TaxID=1963835 RepID=A0A212QZQ7_9PROT|nr:ribonuclease H-like domain-containing protein [Arboricoccus pini]SNB65189.1 ribonuclease D [Arboricoccus pini]